MILGVWVHSLKAFRRRKKCIVVSLSNDDQLSYFVDATEKKTFFCGCLNSCFNVRFSLPALLFL